MICGNGERGSKKKCDVTLIEDFWKKNKQKTTQCMKLDDLPASNLYHFINLNFKFAGTTLAEIWWQMITDNFSTVNEYIKPTDAELQEQTLM